MCYYIQALRERRREAAGMSGRDLENDTGKWKRTKRQLILKLFLTWITVVSWKTYDTR